MTESTASAAPPAPPLKLSIVIPVYNEQATVQTLIRRVVEAPLPGGMTREIVCVNDHSTDGTAPKLDELPALFPDASFQIVHKPHNQGKGAALRDGFARATGDVVLVQDADLEYDPAEIPDVIEPILHGVADAVYGSRFLVRKAARVLYFYHYLANTGLTFLSNMLTNRNMSDIETGYKAFRAEVIKPLVLSSKGFGMEVEITALLCKTNARTYEVPISYYGRPYEEGKKIGFMDGVHALWYIAYYNLVKPRTASGRKYVAAVNAALAKAGVAAAH
jgi:glycosyltransferase involved in cell wall biosynthesis